MPCRCGAQLVDWTSAWGHNIIHLLFVIHLSNEWRWNGVAKPSGKLRLLYELYEQLEKGFQKAVDGYANDRRIDV